jgi:radical SAM protein with 4Fe4S-binding SPASM domain
MTKAKRVKGAELGFFVQWHLTERCNLRCRHCYQGEAAEDELSLPEAKEVVGEVSAMLGDWAGAYGMEFSPAFTVTGGEPFLRKDIFEVLEEISARGFALHVLTNGTLIDRQRALRLAALGVQGVQVSVEGPERVHERIRGAGSFERAFKGIENLLAEGLRVTVNATLWSLNADAASDLVALAARRGVQRFGFSRLAPCGSGRALFDGMLTTEKVREIYTKLLSLGGGGIEVVTGDPLAAQMDLQADTDLGYTPLGGCAAGLSGLTLLPDGTVVPCRRLPIPIGNIRRDSLREVWASSGVLAALRDRGRYRGKCGNCARWAACRGCRAIAYAYTHAKGEADYLAEDPQCFIE